MFRPKIVVLLGAARSREEFAAAHAEEEHAGRICLAPGCFADDPCCKGPGEQERAGDLRVQKIILADEIRVVSPDGYVGRSTQSEIDFARRLTKPVRWGPAPPEK